MNGCWLRTSGFDAFTLFMLSGVCRRFMGSGVSLASGLRSGLRGRVKAKTLQCTASMCSVPGAW